MSDVRGRAHSYEDGRYAYCGEWAEHGFGVSTSQDGTFEGLWSLGRYVSGKLTLASGHVYLGTWRDGHRSGPAVEKGPDGVEYCGDFVSDVRGPYGVLQKTDGACAYRGKWAGGEQTGEGVESFPDGGVYRGQYKNGKRDGYGIRTSYTYENEKAQTARKSSTLDLARRNRLPAAMSGSTRLLAYSRPSLPIFVPPALTSTSRQKSGSTPVLNRVIPGLALDRSFCDSSEVAQKYEGQWENGKRHGYGVVEVVGHFKYYGQWENNRRSGFGVCEYLVTKEKEGGVTKEDKEEEGGRWLNGSCVETAKSSKMKSLLRRNQLEAKVVKARLQALQAANMARESARNADINAAAADAKASTAKSEMKKAVRHAHLAREVVSKTQSVAGLTRPRSVSSVGSGSPSASTSETASEAAGCFVSDSSGSGNDSVTEQPSVGPKGDRDTRDGKQCLSKTFSTPECSLSGQQQGKRETYFRDR